MNENLPPTEERIYTYDEVMSVVTTGIRSAFQFAATHDRARALRTEKRELRSEILRFLTFCLLGFTFLTTDWNGNTAPIRLGRFFGEVCLAYACLSFLFIAIDVISIRRKKRAEDQAANLAAGRNADGTAL